MYMRITKVRIRRASGAGKIKASASITIENAITIHDLKVIEGNKGLFVAMPSRKGADGGLYDIVHPADAATRDQIREAVMTVYGNMADKVPDEYEGYVRDYPAFQ